MQWLYHVIGQVGIFLICAQTLIHFRPRESYEKYLKLLLSVMLLIQLLQPLLTVLGGDPFVVKTITPKVEGVLVVAEGAGKGNMAGEITQIIQALFGVEAHRIKVLEK